jgi:hypothetical protein
MAINSSQAEIWVKISKDDAKKSDFFLPLMKKVDTIKTIRFFRADRGPDYIQLVYFVNRKYSPKLRIFQDWYWGSCNCNDFVMRKKKENLFCKHILAIIDNLNREKRVWE